MITIISIAIIYFGIKWLIKNIDKWDDGSPTIWDTPETIQKWKETHPDWEE